MARGGLGRRFIPDDRDRQYLIRELTPQTSDRTYRYWYDNGAWFDQGDTGTCVGHAVAHYVEDGPVTHPGNVNPMQLYREACLLDGWMENDDPNDYQFGTSVRAGAKALRARGIITTFRWAWHVDDLRLALLEVGPVVMGVNWYSSFDDPDGEGVVQLPPTAYLRGGHAFEVTGYNSNTDLFRAKNNWGREWAREGRFYIPGSVMDRLLAEDGEGMLASENAA